MPGFNFSLENLFKKKWLPYVILAVIVFGVYAQTLNFNFTYLDDNTLILNNYRFISNIGNFFKTFGQDVFHGSGADAFYYRPFLTIYFMMGALISGQGPLGYHFLNIIVHLAAVFLLFIFLQKLDFGRKASFIVSLIFAVHPVLTQAVAWIPGANDSLAAVFILFSFVFFIDYFKTRKWQYLSLHLIFWLGALFTKETAVFAPILFCFYLFLQRKRFSVGDKNKDLSGFLFIVIGWLVMFIFWFVLRYQALGGNVLGMTIGQAFASVYNNLPSVFLYIGKAVFPINLSVFPFLQDQTFVYGLIATAIIAILLYLNRKSIDRKNVAFGIVWFLVFLAPSLLRPNLKTQPDLLEHRIYLPLIGFLIILLEIDWKKIGDRLGGFMNIDPKKINCIFLGLMILTLSATTIIYSRNFENRMSFWLNAVKNSPHAPLAHRNLGAMYWLDGRIDEARTEYEKALALNSNEEMAHNNLGLIYAQKGDYQNAINEYQAELKINPYYDNAFYNEGLAYWNMGKKDGAAKDWEETIRVNPNYSDAYNALITYYQDKGDSKNAEFYYSQLQKALQ